MSDVEKQLHEEQMATYRKRLNANNPRGRELRNRAAKRERDAKIKGRK
jgi:hypothetical protein